MEFIIWFLIFLGILLLCLILVGILIIFKISDKKKIRVTIIDKTYKYNRFKVKTKTLSDGIKYGDDTYIFDSECLVKGKWLDEIYFYQGNPNPIRFKHGSEDLKYTSKDLQKVLDSNLIEKLFSEKRLETIELLQIITLIAVAIILLIVALDTFFLKTDIATVSNQEFIVNAVRTGITRN